MSCARRNSQPQEIREPGGKPDSARRDRVQGGEQEGLRAASGVRLRKQRSAVRAAGKDQ